MLQVLLMEVAHRLPLLVETLPGPFAHRQGFFQDVVAKLRPPVASGWIAFCSVGEHWLHLLRGQEENVPAKRAGRGGRAADSPCGKDKEIHVPTADESRTEVLRAVCVTAPCDDGHIDDSREVRAVGNC